MNNKFEDYESDMPGDSKYHGNIRQIISLIHLPYSIDCSSFMTLTWLSRYFSQSLFSSWTPTFWPDCDKWRRPSWSHANTI